MIIEDYLDNSFFITLFDLLVIKYHSNTNGSVGHHVDSNLNIILKY